MSGLLKDQSISVFQNLFLRYSVSDNGTNVDSFILALGFEHEKTMNKSEGQY
jgi:hypothetical protein